MTPQGTLTILNLAWLYWLCINPVPALVVYGVFLMVVVCVVLKNREANGLQIGEIKNG